MPKLAPQAEAPLSHVAVPPSIWAIVLCDFVQAAIVCLPALLHGKAQRPDLSGFLRQSAAAYVYAATSSRLLI